MCVKCTQPLTAHIVCVKSVCPVVARGPDLGVFLMLSPSGYVSAGMFVMQGRIKPQMTLL